MEFGEVQTAFAGPRDTGRLFLAHRPMLAAVIRRRHRNLFDVEDILQNIFLKLHQKIQSFRGGSKIESWLYRIAINESIDFYRKHRHSLDDISPMEATLADERSEAPDRRAEGKELRQKIEALVEGLEEHLRTAFELYFFKERRVEEISRQLGISHNAVRCRIYKAKLQVLSEAEKSDFFSNLD